MALLFPLGTGIFMLLGLIVVFLTKNNKQIVAFSISMAFSVMTMLVLLELLPEAYEKMSDTISFPLNFILIVGFVGLGILLLKLLDLFIPDHDVAHKENTIPENLFHIGVVSSIALILHNIIEGMAIYSTVTTDASLGFLVTIGVGLHNIPMGMVITSTLYQENTSKIKTILYVFIIALSTFLGGVIMFFLHNFITNLVLGVLLSITLGMLIYIVLFELLEEMFHTHNAKINLYGVLTGIVIFIITLFFE